MSDTNSEDFNEFYDSTSESGDEYVPDSTSGSEGSDSSLDVGTKQWDLDKLCRDSEFMCPAVCDSTTPDLENLSFEFELDKQQQYMWCSEDDEPCSIDSIVVQAPQNRNGNRVYNKRQWLLILQLGLY